VVRLLAIGAEGPEFKMFGAIFQKLTVYPAGNGHPALFRAGEGEGSEEEEWHATSVTQLPVQVDSLTATSMHGQ